jgi:DHA2 family multidrug resistance protein
MGIFNLMKNLGGGVGVSCLGTILSRSTQTHQALLAGRMSPDSTAFVGRLHMVQKGLVARMAGHANQGGYEIMLHTLQREAGTLAYVDVFSFMAVVGIVVLPIVLLFKPAKPKAPPGPPGPAPAGPPK